MRDIVFVLLMMGFVVIAVAFVRACERIVGPRSVLEEERVS